jgi:hypothetical protein
VAALVGRAATYKSSEPDVRFMAEDARDGNHEGDGSGPAEPTFEHVMDLDVEVAEPIEIGDTGDGLRRIIPIVGRRVSGRIEGTILDCGADYQLFRVDRPTKLVAKYAF